MILVRICVRSFGCSSSFADGGVLAGCLAEVGHEIVNSVSEAELVIVNTCAVKGPTENRMIEILNKVPRNKKLIVAGCLPLISFNRIRSETRFDGVTGPAAGRRIVEVVERVSRGEEVIELEETKRNLPKLGLPRVQTNPVVSVIPISYGCLGSCAYCCVNQARGSLRSHEIDEIVMRIKRDITEGFQEFWLTSQDTACYGKDKRTNLVELLWALSGLRGDFRIRVGMMTPNSLFDILEGLIDVFQSYHIFKFIHLPIQSGDDEILGRMRRSYSANDFREIVTVFRARHKCLTLATDIICGFPGETSGAFKHTVEIIEEMKPDIVNVSKFFPRPQTLAATMQNDFVPISETKRRSRDVAEKAKELALAKNLQWVDWQGEILVDEKGKMSCSWIGRNFAYKPVVIKSVTNLLGKKLRVEIVEAFPTYLKGKIIN